MALRLVLVRHGLSSFNAKGLIQGRTDDSLLTDEGYEQARKAGKALSKINFDKIYSSPLVRAAETAKTIKKTFNKEQNIVFDDNLLEEMNKFCRSLYLIMLFLLCVPVHILHQLIMNHLFDLELILLH